MVSNLMKCALFSLFLVGGTNLIGTTYAIGEYAEGGVIFWLRPDLEHGLVVSVVDMSDGGTLNWSLGGLYNTIGATGNNLVFGGSYTTPGKLNSGLIVNQYGAGALYAAGACAGYEYTDTNTEVLYSDYFLPSLAELGVLMSNLDNVNPALAGIPGATTVQAETYWSSTEGDTDHAWAQSFFDASQGASEKNTLFLVRAIRSF